MAVGLVLEGCCLAIKLLVLSFLGAHHAGDLSLLVSDSRQFSLYALELLLVEGAIAVAEHKLRTWSCGVYRRLHVLNIVINVVLVLISILFSALLSSRGVLGFLNQPEKILVASSEIWIRVFAGALILALARSHRIVRQAHLVMESIHVELANKRGVVVVLEQFGDEGFGKLVFVKHNEGVAIV